jgi:hypothetical protein
MSVGGGGDRDEALAHPLAVKIGVNNLSMKKSSIGGNQYLVMILTFS